MAKEKNKTLADVLSKTNMTDIGEKMNARPVKARTNEVYYPSIRLMESQLKELKGKKVGDSCKFVVESNVKEISQIEKNKTEYRLEMRKIGPVKTK